MLRGPDYLYRCPKCSALVMSGPVISNRLNWGATWNSAFAVRGIAVHWPNVAGNTRDLRCPSQITQSSSYALTQLLMATMFPDRLQHKIAR
jgi:hypothetical protein